MKEKLKSIPKWCYIVVIAILVIVLIVSFDNSSIENNQNYNEKFTYESNNKYGSDFEYNDIDIAEEAIYAKYKSEEAEKKIMNQKIFVRIKKIEVETLTDESTSTTKVYRAIAVDQNKNKWQVICDDDNYIVSALENIKVYGLYKGLSDDGLPIIESHDSSVDLNYLNKKEFMGIAENYLTVLQKMYSKEKFSYSNCEEGINNLDLNYKNENNDLELTIDIDVKKKQINQIEVYISKSSIEIDDVDRDFWYAIIMAFDTNLSIDDAKNMFATATAMDMLDKKETMFDGFKYKGNEISINLEFRNLYIWKS